MNFGLPVQLYVVKEQEMNSTLFTSHNALNLTTVALIYVIFLMNIKINVMILHILLEEG